MLRRIDPYLVWRLLVTPELVLAVLGPQKERDSEVLHTILVEKDKADGALVNPNFLGPGDELLQLNDQYLPAHTHAAWGSGFMPRHQPGLITGLGLRLLFKLSYERQAELCNNVVRWEYCQAGEPMDFRAEVVDSGAQARPQVPTSRPVERQELARSLSEQARQGAETWRPPTAASRAQQLPAPKPKPKPRICVIDDGCNFASPTVAGSLRQLLVQATDRQTLDDLDAAGQFRPALEMTKSGAGWLFNGSLLGRRMRFDRPAARRVSDAAKPAGAEPDHYRQAGYLHPTPHVRHGAAVLDLVANPLLRIGDQPVQRPHPTEVHFVQLPTPTVLDTAGGSLAAQVLTGLHDALNATQPWQDLLVNLSFGTHGGSHDGTSLMESAYLELLDAFHGGDTTQGKRLMLAVPAGNSHLMRCHSQGWAQPGRASSFDWKVLPDDDSHNFVELWLPKGRSGLVTVQHPDGRGQTDLIWSPDPDRGHSIEPVELGNGKSDMANGYLMYAENPSQSTTCAMVLLGVLANSRLKTDPERYIELTEWLSSPTTQTFGAHEGLRKDVRDHCARHAGPPGPAAHGIWRISIQPSDGKPLPWHAYVQRGDHAPMRRRAARGSVGRQSYIMDNGKSQATPMATLNGIATARHARLFVVGSLERADGRLSEYSSAGSNTSMATQPASDAPDVGERTEGPDWVVAGDESRRRPGLLVQGVLSGARVRVSGTSMSTASLTRHLWEHLAANKPLETFMGPPSQDQPAPTKVPASAADHAPDFTRGYFRRITPASADGSLT